MPKAMTNELTENSVLHKYCREACCSQWLKSMLFSMAKVMTNEPPLDLPPLRCDTPLLQPEMLDFETIY